MSDQTNCNVHPLCIEKRRAKKCGIKNVAFIERNSLAIDPDSGEVFTDTAELIWSEYFCRACGEELGDDFESVKQHFTSEVPS